MRGRTLKNSFAILDEAQNAPATQIKMFLTRIGENSKLVVNGDPSQIDLNNKSHSGLNRSIKILNKLNEIKIIEFDYRDVVRHPLVSKIITAYQKISENHSAEQLDRVSEELRDRFGPIPAATKNLIKTSLIQCLFYYAPIIKCEITFSSASFYLSGPPGGLGPKQFILALKEELKSFLCPHQIGVGEKNEMKISFKVASLDEGLSFSKKFGKLFSRAFSL